MSNYIPGKSMGKPSVDAPPTISVVIVNWNTRDMLIDCLRYVYSAIKRTSFEVIVVDNGSEDGSVGAVRATYPGVRIIANEKNLGFARGNNQGIRDSRGKYVLLLNADTCAQEEAFDRMVEFMDAHTEAGAVGCTLLNRDRSWQRGTAGRFPSLLTAFNFFFPISRFLPTNIRWLQAMFLDRPPRNTIEVDWVSSACVLCRPKALEEAGLLPTHYFIALEDVECCYNLRQKGWKIYYYTGAEVIHYTNNTLVKKVKPGAPSAWRSLSIYFYQHYGLPQTIILQGLGMAAYSIRSFIYLIAWLLLFDHELRDKSGLWWARAQLVCTIFRGIVRGENWASVKEGLQ